MAHRVVSDAEHVTRMASTKARGTERGNWRERLVEKRDSLKEQEAKLKMMKGRPVALKKFLEEVVLPGCVLCPP